MTSAAKQPHSQFIRRASRVLNASSEPALFGRLIILFMLILNSQIGCAGYHLGNQFLYRNDIRSVHVEMIESDSYRRFLGQQLTEAIVKQIESQTPLTITEPALANSFVRGRILRDVKRIQAETRQDDPRDIQTGWQVEITWVDRAGVPLMQRQILRIDQDVDFIPEGGQSLATAQLEMVERLARQIVGQMETPW